MEIPPVKRHDFHFARGQFYAHLIFVVPRVGLATFGKVRVALDPGQHAGLFLARVGMQTLEGVKVLPPT